MSVQCLSFSDILLCIIVSQTVMC